jgi:cobalt-zinc-cadmium efflux system membrane fusion protein
MLRRFSGPALGRKFTPFGALCLAILVLAALLCTPASHAVAHEGHDLAPSTVAPGAPGHPRLVASSESYELVAILDGERLTVYLDQFGDNAPVTDATMTVTIDDESTVAEAVADGTYAVVSKRFGGRGLAELVFDIRRPGADDLLIGKMSLGNAAATDDPSRVTALPVQIWSYLRHGAEDHLLLMSLMLLVGLALGLELRRWRLPALPVVALMISAVAVMATPRPACAHEGHDLLDEGKAATGDTARRLPDGQVFVPKPMQRILDIRTVIAKPQTLSKAEVFVGRVMTDPNRSGLVQSITGGRVVAPEQGLPRIGQSIAKGDVLASIEPPMALADRTTISERTGEIEQMIAVAEAKLRRLRAMAEHQVVPQSLVVETEAELEGLYRRREVVRETRIAPEVLRAPIDGVIAISHVVAGQVVRAQDVLFQVVDPNTLWVEAYDYGDNDPATLKHAMALGPGDHPMNLGFQGWSRTLQQQATVLQFMILDPPPSIRVGQPVTVTAQRSETVSGVIIARDAVVRGGNGETVVWRHADPERFEARPVRIEPFDATRVLIAAGIGEGERIVTSGAELINQIH